MQDFLDEQDLPVFDKLNAETSTVSWQALQRLYAKGVVRVVAIGMDLVDVASHLASDNAELVGQWIESKQIDLVSPDQARHWYQEDAHVWAVVVAPWILVQEIPPHSTH